MGNTLKAVLLTDTLNVDAIERWLTKLNFSVDRINSRNRLQTQLTNTSVKLLVVDEDCIDSPFDFLGWLKDKSPTTRLILVGDNLSPTRALTWINYGGTAYYRPPVDESQFLSKAQSIKAGMESQSFLLETHQNLTELLRKEQEDLKKEAERDDLTDLLDKKYFEMKSKRLLEECERSGQAFSIIVFDIDHFKTYNDNNGHPAGDEALKTVAELVREEVRKDDVVGRIGGEEFAVTTPYSDHFGSYKIAERIRKIIRNHRFPGENCLPDQTLSLSLGLASYPEHGNELSRLLEVADRATYQAKRSGRNQVVRTALQNFSYETDEHETVESVSVVGSFNGWRPGEDPLKRQSPGYWKAEIPVPEGSIEYAYSINGEQIERDQSKGETVTGPGGEPVSKITV